MLSPLFAVTFPEITTPLIFIILIVVLIIVIPQRASAMGKMDGGAWETLGFVVAGIFIGIILAFNPAWHDSMREWSLVKWVWSGTPAASAPADTKTTLAAPKNPTYNPSTGEVSVEDAPPAGSTLLIYWKNGLKLQDASGGNKFPGKTGNVGTGATEIHVRFYNEATKEMSNAIAVK